MNLGRVNSIFERVVCRWIKELLSEFAKSYLGQATPMITCRFTLVHTNNKNVAVHKKIIAGEFCVHCRKLVLNHPYSELLISSACCRLQGKKRGYVPREKRPVKLRFLEAL